MYQLFLVLIIQGRKNPDPNCLWQVNFGSGLVKIEVQITVNAL